MLQSQILAHFQEQANCLMAGDLQRFEDMFSLPLPIHFPNGMTVVLDQECGGQILNQIRDELLSRGVVCSRPEISAVELPKADRFRVWIDWKETTADGIEVSGPSIVYYCRKSPTGLRTEMVQYTKVASIGIATDQTVIARSA